MISKKLSILNGQLFPSIIIIENNKSLFIRINNYDDETYTLKVENLLNGLEIRPYNTGTLLLQIYNHGIYKITLNDSFAGSLIVLPSQ